MSAAPKKAPPPKRNAPTVAPVEAGKQSSEGTKLVARVYPTKAENFKRVGAASTATEAQYRRIVKMLRISPKTTIDFRRNGIMSPAARIKEMNERHGFYIPTIEVRDVYDDEGFLHPRVAVYELIDEPAVGV